jgi:hypothetical protein
MPRGGGYTYAEGIAFFPKALRPPLPLSLCFANWLYHLMAMKAGSIVVLMVSQAG